MATPIVLPKLGNTVESSIILEWHKSIGDAVSEGDILVEVETDKATMEVESPVSGTLLAQLVNEGDDVPVMANIAVVGEPGESFDDLLAESVAEASNGATVESTPAPSTPEPVAPKSTPTPAPSSNGDSDGFLRISPRARNLAQQKQVDIHAITGTGPMGRIIERDIKAALRNQPLITPVARRMLDTGEYTAPQQGSGPMGRITKTDLVPAKQAQPDVAASSTVANGAASADSNEGVEVIPLKGIRKTIARRMLESMQTTAQLTLTNSAPAQALLDMRKWLKNSPAALGLRSVTINDLVMYAVVKTLANFPDLNMLFENDTLYKYRAINLGFAVDTPRGLVVPVIHNAGEMTLIDMANRAHELADATLNQRITPDEMSAGTFTVSNLGNLGVQVFTPVLNLPQVAILGVGSIEPKPIPTADGYDFAPHITFSLTINHQVVDGAPGARFLKSLAENIANIQEL